MSSAAEYGVVASVAIVVHEPLPAGARWKSRWSIPEPESAAEPVSVFVPRRYVPGSSWLVVGDVLSILTFVTAADGAELPARSDTTTRSW